MARVAARVTDKRVLKLIRAFPKSGAMEDGLVSPVDEGTPQGGPLSPLLSNLVLDDLDKELTRRGHRFAATRTTAISMFAATALVNG
jgi:RNA-directed DNA polymerase